MVDEEYAKQVIHLSLVPVGAVVEVRDGGHGGCFVGVRLDADSRVVPHAEEVVNDFEAVVAGGIVDGGEVGDHGEFGRGVQFEEGDDRFDAGGRDVEREFVLPYRESDYRHQSCAYPTCDGVLYALLNVFWKTREQILAILMQGLGLFLMRVCHCLLDPSLIIWLLFGTTVSMSSPAGLTIGTVRRS